MKLTAAILLLTTLACVAACGGDTSAPGGGTPVMLPDAYYGAWEATGTSGGLDGKGVALPPGPPITIVITRANTWETRGSEAAAAGRPFIVKRGKTIFSAEPQWMITFVGGGEALVLQLSPDDTLTTSENVYDGFSTSYRRGKHGP